MRCFKFNQSANDILTQLMRMALRPSRTISETINTFINKSVQPLVTGLAADPKIPANRIKRIILPEYSHDKFGTLLHYIDLLPGHGQSPSSIDLFLT
jgi:hypothetical protein